MNLPFLRSGEIQEDNVLPKVSFGFNLGELCDCVVDLIP